MNVGEGKSIEIHGSNMGTIEIVNNNPDIVSAQKGGDTGGSGTIGFNSGRFSWGYTHLDISALASGIATVKVTDTGTNEESTLTIIVADSSSDSPVEAVDLGLPSGTLWASCNLGATKPEEKGKFYAWGGDKGSRRRISREFEKLCFFW